MTVYVAWLWRALHPMPWRLAETCARYGLSSLLGIALVWYALGPDHRWWMWVAGVLLLILSLGPDALTRASSLTNLLKLAYRRTRIRLVWTSAMMRAKLFEIEHIADMHSLRSTPGGKKVPKLYRWGRKRIRVTRTGLVLTVDGSRIGAGPSAFEGEQAPILCAKWQARDLIVSAHPRWPWLTQLRVIFVDPFAEVIRPSGLPHPPKLGLVVVGKDSDHEPVIKDVRLSHLVAGSPGAGKSSECWMVLWSLVKQGLPFRTRVYDPKGGQEFFDMADKAYRYEANPTKWCEFLEEALSAMAAQQAALKAAGIRKWLPGDERFPLDVMIIDELVTVIAMMAGAENKVTINGKKVPAIKAFQVYLSQGRAAGFTVIACTQLAQKEAIGVVRDLFAYVTCLRVGSDDMVRTILGDPKLYPAHQIPPGDEHAGVGYMSTDRGPLKYRSAYLEDDERATVAEAIGKWSRKYWSSTKHSKTPITLDLGNASLEITEEEQEILDEVVKVCSKCRAEVDDDFDAELNKLVQERINELNGSAA